MASTRLLGLFSLLCLILAGLVGAAAVGIAITRGLNGGEPPAAGAEANSAQPKGAAPGQEFKPFEVRPSAWAEREKHLFAQVLNGSKCDVLVVPFEAQGRSVDRVGRSLMARSIASEIVSRTGLCVVDPTLAARALGARSRAYDWSQVASLADATGVRFVVRGHAALADSGGVFRINLSLYRRADAAAGWSEPETQPSLSVAYADELPPEASFAEHVANLVTALRLPATAASAVLPDAQAHAGGVPAAPRGLVSDAGLAIDRAERLQLLGVMLGAADEDAAHLWERSLIAIAGNDAADPRVATARARASLHLHRRPYAIKLLNGLDTPEARALRSVADGDLPAAEKRAAELTQPRGALIAAVEVEALRERYGTAAVIGFEARRAVLMRRYPAYAALLYAPMSSGDWFHTPVHVLVARHLKGDDALGTAAAVVLSAVADSKAGASLGSVPTALGYEIEANYATVWERRAGEWRSQRAFDRLAVWDIYDAAHAANRAALVRTSRSLRESLARPGETVQMVKALPSEFADYPPIQAEAVLAQNELELESGEATALQPSAQVTARAREVYAWEGAETATSDAVDDLLRDPHAYFYADEPMRPWRPVERNRADRFDPTRLDEKRAGANARHYTRAAAYTQHEFWYLERAYAYLKQAGRKEDAARLVEDNRHRFIGHFLRDRFFAARAREAGDADTELALLASAIRAQPDLWTNYYELAAAQLRHRQAEAAQRTLLSYPQFQRTEAHPVALANEASEAGRLLFRAGEPKLAEPLLETALRSRTGSASEMFSGVRLSMARGDFREALAWAGRLHERYRSEWALPMAATFQFLLGERKDGWATFDEAARTQASALPWTAAFDGHRMEGTSDADIVKFASAWRSKTGPPALEAMLKEHFVFNMLMIDRSASAEALQSVLAFQGRSGDRAYALAANGYHAFRAGDHAKALQQFSELHKALFNFSVNAHRPTDYALPYMTAALLRAGRRADAEALVTSAREGLGTDFYTLIAQAFLDGHAGRVGPAQAGLWEAFLERPGDDEAAVPPSFQLLEAGEILLDMTGAAAYRDLTAELARRQSKAWPYSWAFSFLAKHASDPGERERALGVALFLDARSERLQGFSEIERKRAAAWFAKNQPFAGSKNKLRTAAL